MSYQHIKKDPTTRNLRENTFIYKYDDKIKVLVDY